LSAGGFGSSAAAAAALQQAAAAAALNTSGTSLLGAGGNLDLLAARSDLTARELALSNLAAQAGLGRSLNSQSTPPSSSLPVSGKLFNTTFKSQINFLID
jgi:hypothetical protein